MIQPRILGISRLFMQVVYDTNKLGGLVEEKKQMENWRDYYELKYGRSPSKRPTCKVKLE